MQIERYHKLLWFSPSELEAPLSENLFITDIGRGSIYSMNLTGGPQVNITEEGTLMPAGLAYNDKTRNLFYTNEAIGNSYIARLSLRTGEENRLRISSGEFTESYLWQNLLNIRFMIYGWLWII